MIENCFYLNSSFCLSIFIIWAFFRWLFALLCYAWRDCFQDSIVFHFGNNNRIINTFVKKMPNSNKITTIVENCSAETNPKVEAWCISRYSKEFSPFAATEIHFGKTAKTKYHTGITKPISTRDEANQFRSQAHTHTQVLLKDIFVNLKHER